MGEDGKEQHLEGKTEGKQERKMQYLARKKETL